MSSSWGSNSSKSSSRSDVENSFDVDELLQIGTRCRELRKEKEMLRESQSHSVELVRRLEMNATSLSESNLEDKRRIQMMEKELLNCYQEIDYLRDEVNFRGKEVKYLSERVLHLEIKVTESGNLEEQVNSLREELCASKSEQLLLLQELESTETELHLSVFSVEKLEESISSLTLESQCEIESMKLDIVALEQAKKEEYVNYLEKQNKELKERFSASERNVEEFCQSFKQRLESESELVKQLKEELREEKLKGKEEAEDLTQEMAELRYKMTSLLEEECKRRACIEQASLQRIANLETQIKREKNKSSTCISRGSS